MSEQVPQRTFDVGITDVVRYAGASGDLNPIHHNPDAARAAGMKGAFAHGMYSAGILATALTDAFGIGSLARYDVRFKAQAWVGEPLTTSITVTGQGDDGGEVEASLVNADGAAVVTATATTTAASALVESSDGPADDSTEADGSANGAAASSLVGTPLTPAVVVIERGAVQRFAAALHDDSPAYRSVAAAKDLGFAGIPVPPTFVFAAVLLGSFDDEQPPAPAGSKTLIELIAALRGGRKGVILHGSQEFVFHTPALVSDVLDATGYVESLTEKPSMTVLVVRTDYRNPAGNLVTTSRATYLFRPAA